MCDRTLTTIFDLLYCITTAFITYSMGSQVNEHKTLKLLKKEIILSDFQFIKKHSGSSVDQSHS